MQLIETAKQNTLGNYVPAPIVLAEGRGTRVRDVEGNEYLDLSGGIAVLSVGHAHPKLASAIFEQAQKLTHVSNIFYNEKAIELASELKQRTPFDRFYFCNSGTEANEAMIKLARRWHFEHGHPQRTEFIATEHSFHGRTMGAVSLTGQPKYHQGIKPLLPGIYHVPFNDLEAMKNAVSKKTAAIIVEPIQAEGGIFVGTDAYLQGLRELCDQHGILLLFDEVQTGFGRTGKFLGCEWSHVTPDACSLAKGIAGGFPLGAMALKEKFADGLPPGSHASTFGGNPLACAAALAVLCIFDEEKVIENAHHLGNQVAQTIQAWASDENIPAVVGNRGRGLLQAIVLHGSITPQTVQKNLLEKKLLVSVVGGNAVRLSPSLNISLQELEKGLSIIEATLKEIEIKK